MSDGRQTFAHSVGQKAQHLPCTSNPAIITIYLQRHQHGPQPARLHCGARLNNTQFEHRSFSSLKRIASSRRFLRAFAVEAVRR
jgi:hypothetical protein